MTRGGTERRSVASTPRRHRLRCRVKTPHGHSGPRRVRLRNSRTYRRHAWTVSVVRGDRGAHWPREIAAEGAEWEGIAAGQGEEGVQVTACIDPLDRHI
jgi:hypothetical protein